MNELIGKTLFLITTLTVWWLLSLFPWWVGFTIIIPPILAIMVSVTACEFAGIIRFVPELRVLLVIDEITGKERIVGVGIQFFVPWEKVEGNIFDTSQVSQTFGGQFETINNSGVVVRVQITIVPDTKSVKSVSAFNRLGADPIRQAFKRYGPASGEVIQQVIAKFTLDEIQADPLALRERLRKVLDYGVSIIEERTGTVVEAIEIESIDPDPETLKIQSFDRRVEVQMDRALKICVVSGNKMCFEKALEAVQRADAESKVSQIAIRGGARGFFDVTN